jgi:hypothetical protein
MVNTPQLSNLGKVMILQKLSTWQQIMSKLRKMKMIHQYWTSQKVMELQRSEYEKQKAIISKSTPE